MASIAFLYPKFLMLLLLVPFFVFVYFFSLVYNKKKAIVFSNFRAMERFYNVEFFSKNFILLYLNLAVLILIILAMAGTSVSMDIDTSSYSYILAVDNSGSMSVSDVVPSRFEVAKTEAKRFVDLMPAGVEIGVIGFSGDAVVMQTPDSSKMKARMAIDNLEVGKIQGTNIYNALITSNKLFEDRQMKSIILISDGQLNVGDSVQINRYANRNNLVVNTIAIGTSEGGEDGYGMISKSDEDFLKALAFNTGGNFFRATDDKSLEDSFNSLIYETNRNVNFDLSFYLLLGAIVIFSLNWIAYNLRFKMIP